jgi:CheY-like chemotaxis protein
MGGQIGVESVEARGTTFSFTVVLEKPLQPAKPTDAPASDLRGTKVLVVDDHAGNVLHVSRLLASWGCRCGDATDGVSAPVAPQKAAATGEPCDAALLDAELRDVPLRAIAEQIKGDPRIATTSLVVMTALGRRHGGIEWHSRGVSVCVTKPVRRQHLRAGIEQALGRPATGKVAGHGPPATGDAAARAQPAHARILLAEDNEVNQKVALAIPGKLGYRADAVTHGREALAALLTNHYDITLVLISGFLVGQAQPAQKADTWAAYRFLLGQWTGEGDEPGASSASVRQRVSDSGHSRPELRP